MRRDRVRLPDGDSSHGPEVGLDWEMGIFVALRGIWRKVRSHRTTGDMAVSVAEDPERWSLFASLFAGRAVRVLEASGGGGIRGDTLLIPPLSVTGQSDLDGGLLVLRIAVDATTCARRSSDGHELEAQRSVEDLCSSMPRFAEAWTDALGLVRSLSPDCGPLGPSGVLWGPVLEIALPEGEGSQDLEAPPAAGSSEADARVADEIAVLDLADHDETELPIHAFERVETLEPFSGSMRQLDGEDDLNAHLEALEEVDLGHLLRGGPQVHSVLRADVALDAEVPDIHHFAADEQGLAYDEWDGRKRQWRRDWCRVYPTPIPGGDDAWAAATLSRHSRLVERLYQALLAHRQQHQLCSRQPTGDDVDIDALVHAWADLRAGRDPGNRLYTQRTRRLRDLATTVLVDISLSADAWVNDRRVLDIARESVLVLGEVAERLGDRVQVLAFASHTRHKVRVWTVRDFAEPWRQGRARLGRLTPQGYTRIGPAIRYAADQLAAEHARDRLLLVVSDGKPTDYDCYEGRYGMSDVRMALNQARQRGIRVHALAVDTVARQTLPMMMGPGCWDVLPHPEHLPEALTRAWGRANGAGG